MPGLRLGYMIVPNNLISDIIAAKFSADISSSGLFKWHFIFSLKKAI